MTCHTSADVFCILDWRSKFLSHIGTELQTLPPILLHTVLTTWYARVPSLFVSKPTVGSHSTPTYTCIVRSRSRHYIPHRQLHWYWRDRITAPLAPYSWHARWRHTLVPSVRATYLCMTTLLSSYLYSSSVPHHLAVRTAFLIIAPCVAASGSAGRVL